MTDDFDLYARFYDPDLDGFDADLQMYEQFAARCDSPILELGCGPGDYTIMLARRGAQVTAIDIAPTSLGITRERAQAAVAGSTRSEHTVDGCAARPLEV